MRTRGHTQTLMPTDVSSPPLTPACITDTTTGPPAALPAHLLGSQMGSCGQRGPGMDASIGKGTGSWHLPPISALGHSQDHHTLPSRVHISGHGMPALGPHPLPRPESSLRPWLTMSQVDTLQGCWTARKPPLCGVGRCRRTGCPTQLTRRAQGPDPQSAACWGCEDSPLASSSCPVVSVRTAYEPITLSDLGSKCLSEGSLSCHQLACRSDSKGTAGS